MSNKIYRIIGNEGRVTIPHQMRLCAGLTSNAVVSFELVSGDAVLVRREQLQDQREFQSEMDGKKGLFVSMPQESFPGKDGQKQYSNTFFALTNSAKMQLQEVVLDAYKLSLDPNYVPNQSQGQHDYPQHVQHQLDYYGGQYHQQYPEPGYPDWMNDYNGPVSPMDMGGM